MGSFLSTQTEPSRSTALVKYDNAKAREAVQHIKSDFVDPRSLVDNLVPGDMIQKKGNFIHQWFYSHFAIYIGNGEIVHVITPSNKENGKTAISRERMEDAFKGELVRKNNHLDNAPAFRNKIQQPHKIVKAARDRVGEPWDYNFLTYNCEHFATWCRYGREVSLQSWAIGDVISGKISLGEYVDHSIYGIAEKLTTFWSWLKRKTMGFVDSIG
jgi:hypothetical protein